MQHTHEIPLNTFGYASLAEVKFRGGLPGAGRQAQPRNVQRGMRGHAGGWGALGGLIRVCCGKS